jgi:putative SOS response-associated peptidase YedK
MCARYYSRSERQQIAEQFHAGKVFAGPLDPNFNLAPTTFQPDVRVDRDSDVRRIVLWVWTWSRVSQLVPLTSRGLLRTIRVPRRWQHRQLGVSPQTSQALYKTSDSRAQ